MEESQQPISREMWYQGQKAMADNIKQLTEISKSNQHEITDLKETIDEYIHDDMKWKKTAEPVIELGNNARGASKVGLYILGVIITIGGAWAIIKDLFKKP